MKILESMSVSTIKVSHTDSPNFLPDTVEMRPGVCTAKDVVETVETAGIAAVPPAARHGSLLPLLLEQINELMSKIQVSVYEFAKLQASGGDPVRLESLKQEMRHQLAALKAFLSVYSVKLADESPEVRAAEQQRMDSFAILAQQMEFMINQISSPLAVPSPTTPMVRESQPPRYSSPPAVENDQGVSETILQQLQNVCASAATADVTAAARRAASNGVDCCTKPDNALGATRQIIQQLTAGGFDAVLFHSTCWECSAHNGKFLAQVVDALQPLLPGDVYALTRSIAKQSHMVKSVCPATCCAGIIIPLAGAAGWGVIAAGYTGGEAMALAISTTVIGAGLLLGSGIAYGACKASSLSKAEAFNRSRAV